MPGQEEQLLEFLDWQQACARIGCSRAHFYRLVSDGQIPCAYRMGRRKGIRVLSKDVEAYLHRLKNAGP